VKTEPIIARLSYQDQKLFLFVFHVSRDIYYALQVLNQGYLFLFNFNFFQKKLKLNLKIKI